MMSSPFALVLLFAGGVGAGLVFFGGLWLTVRTLPTARYPAALALASFWGRTALAVAAFAWIFSRDWKSGLVFVLGFIGARLLLGRWVPRQADRAS